ncbi:MAG: hypothetical protein CMF49_01765 [Legionellales bacterium]|nr:hypothetical protein [Legionellales bacterium]|tara:strand:- start:213 stop:1385 length:1173 start_codon:yes stop_codon:yes gene_type:complete
MSSSIKNSFINIIIIYTSILFLSNDAYLPALPAVMSSLSTSYHSTQLSLTTWFLGSACVQLFLGAISDRFGRRPCVLIGAGVFIMTSLLCAFSPNISIFLIARLFQGASVATMLVAGYACIHEYFDSEYAVKVLGKMNSVTVLAPALGPLLGAGFLLFMGWRSIFLFLGFAATLCLIGLIYKLPETIQEQHPLHLKRLLKQYKNVLLNHGFFFNSLSYCAIFAGLITWITAGPFLVVDVFKLNTLYFAILQGIIFGAFILGSLSLKFNFVTKYQVRIILPMLFLILITSLISVILSYFYPQMLSSLIIPLCIYAFAGGILMPILSRKAIDSCTAPMGVIIAVQATMLSTFGALSSAAVGYFYHHTLFPITLIIFILTFLAYLRTFFIFGY